MCISCYKNMLNKNSKKIIKLLSKIINTYFFKLNIVNKSLNNISTQLTPISSLLII